jgi:hypothetical protein
MTEMVEMPIWLFLEKASLFLLYYVRLLNFNITSGEILAGNDYVEIMEKMKKEYQILQDKGIIPKEIPFVSRMEVNKDE